MQYQFVRLIVDVPHGQAIKITHGKVAKAVKAKRIVAHQFTLGLGV